MIELHAKTRLTLSNRHLVHRLFRDLFSKGNLAVADEIIAANHVNHDPATPYFGKGPEGVKQIVTLYRRAFPDLHFTIDQIIDADDFLAVRYTATGTHKAAEIRNPFHQRSRRGRPHIACLQYHAFRTFAQRLLTSKRGA